MGHMKHKPFGTCPLCLNERRLIESHIIPEFFIEVLRDQKRRFLAVQPARRTARLAQQAFTQPLLCAECDNDLNHRYEQHLLDIWYKRGTAPKIIFGPVYNLALPDYATFKLALLSILWRAGVAKRPPFQDVDLGEWEPELREMLLNKNPGRAHDCPIFGAVVIIPDTLQVANVVSAPIETEWEGSPGYMFIFGGVAWHFVLRNEPLSSDLQAWTLQEDGKWSLPVMQMSDLKAFHNVFADYAAHAAAKGWKSPWSTRH